MTRQEVINLLSRILIHCDPTYCSYNDCDDCIKAVSIAEEVLRQEPSKKYDYSKSVWENIQEGNGISKDIPKEPKRGRWILGKEVSREYIGDICVGVEYDGWQCSSCKTKVEKPYKPNWNYCPNCGAKMEVEE